MNRSKKVVIIMTILTCLFTFQAFSIGAGIQFGLCPAFDINASEIKNTDFEGNITGSLKLFRLPVNLGLGLNFGVEKSLLSFGLAAFTDYWVLDMQLVNTWNFYAGIGAYLKLMTNSCWNIQSTIGSRFFAGMNWLFIDNYLEYYVQINTIPSYVRNFSDRNGFFRLITPLETGLRVHF